MCCSEGSKGCASTPRRSRASSTARPLLTEIARSAERPPSKTATFPKFWFLIMSLIPGRKRRGIVGSSPSGGRSNNPHFRYQFDAGLVFYRVAHRHYQRFDIRRGCSAGVDNEVCMLGRDHSPANPKTFQSARLDQSGGPIPFRIAKHGTGVWQVQRLAIDTHGEQVLNLLPRLGLFAAQ